MKSILILFQRDIVGGNTTYTLNLIHQLSNYLNVTVLCSKNNRCLLSSFIESNVNKINIVEVKTKFFILSESVNLQTELIKNKYDYVFSPNTMFTFAIYPKGIKKIITVHDLNFKFLNFSFFHKLYKEVLYRLSFYLSDYIIYISKKTMHDVGKYYNVYGKELVIWNGIDKIWLEQPLIDAFHRGEYFISFGHHAHKNIEGSIEFTKNYNKKYNENFQLYVIGESLDLNFIKNKYKNDKEIVFLGKISQIDLMYAIGNSKCLLFLSMFEGFGLPVFEAFALGTPVVISPIDALLEVSQGRAIVCDFRDQTDAIDRLYQLLSSSENYDRYAFELRNYVSPFTWEKTAKSIIEYISKDEV